MVRKTIYLFLIAIAFFITTTLAAAQTQQVRGKVTMDGKPVKGAVVDIYRQDLPGTYELKTGNDGVFQHAGLPFIGTYIISVSAAGATPQARGPMRLGNAELLVELTTGDGKRLTKDEAKQWAAAGAPKTGGQQTESAEAKKAREEFLKEKERIDAANKKAESSNAIYDRAMKEGNDAFRAKNYDEAILKYDEALNTDPDHPTAPILMTNKAVVLKQRGVDRYVASNGIKEPDAKIEAINAARKDFLESADFATKAVAGLKTMEKPADSEGQARYKLNFYNALTARADALRLVAKIADTSKADEAYNAYQEIIAVETVPEQKAKFEMSAANVLLDAGISDRALAEFKKLIETDPNNYSAYRGAGIALFQTQAKENYQEAANYLQLYVDKSPDSTDKDEVKGILDYLKTEGVKAQKINTPAKTTPKKKPN